jgi:ApaG protein
MTSKLERSLFRSLLRFSRKTKSTTQSSVYLQHHLNPNAEVSWLYFDSKANDNAIIKNLLDWPVAIEDKIVGSHLCDNSRWVTGDRMHKIVCESFRIPVQGEERDKHIDFAMEALRELQLLSKLTEQTSVVRDESGLVITCTSIFSEADSQLQFEHFTHYYRILIENAGDSPVQLLNRSWVFCGDGSPPVILPRWAPGVVGERPLLNTGEGFHYMSSTRIQASNGYMEGTFQFSNAEGELFEVPVGRTALTAHEFFDFE